MVRGCVERVEAVILIFYLRSVRDDKADFAKAADDVFGDLRQRVELAQRTAASGQCEIGWLTRERGFQFQFRPALGEGGFQLDLGQVHELAGRRLLFLRQSAKLLQQGGKLSLGAE